jgi:hypothetical protein
MAASVAIEKGRNLFSGKLETVDQRLARMHKEKVAYFRRQRQGQADQWRKARRILYSLDFGTRVSLLRDWNGQRCPADPYYLSDFLHHKGHI